MNTIAKRLVAFVASCLLTGCAAQRYRPAPIVPSASASQFESRSLADSGLRSFEERNLGHTIFPWPPKEWDLQTLSLATLYFNPSLDLVRARLADAKGAVVTASARPNPTFDLTPGVPNPYLLTQDFLFAIETAGKRRLRIQIAGNLNDAARFDLADSAWTTFMGLRLAFLNYLAASQNLDLLRSEQKSREDQVAILEQVLSAGEITRFDVDLARIDLSKTTVAIHTAEGQVADAKAALATAIGIPMGALGGIEYSWPDMDKPPTPTSLSPDQVQREAVLNRLDIRRSLAQYSAAEAALHLEVAKQYPNFNIGPGYTYEERVHWPNRECMVALRILKGRALFHNRWLAFSCVVASLLGAPANARELKPETVTAFDRYIHTTEERMAEDLRQGHFLVVDNLPDGDRQQTYSRLKQGEFYIEPLRTKEDGKPIPVPGGLIHHWVGVVFIPGATLSQILAVLQDYDNHKIIYKPDVRDSKLLTRDGNDFKVYLQFYRKSLVTVVVNVNLNIRYTLIGATRATSKSYSTRIAELEDAGKPDEHELPVGNDHGYVWRLYSYWRIEEKDGGVYIQVESIGLSRTIPWAIAWLVNPLVRGIPRSVLSRLLENTRRGVETKSNLRTLSHLASDELFPKTRDVAA